MLHQRSNTTYPTPARDTALYLFTSGVRTQVLAREIVRLYSIKQKSMATVATSVGITPDAVRAFLVINDLTIRGPGRVKGVSPAVAKN